MGLSISTESGFAARTHRVVGSFNVKRLGYRVYTGCPMDTMCSDIVVRTQMHQRRTDHFTAICIPSASLR
ncbi:hypothetical protein CYMTET_46889 [Cymbomonas tetramitiformis]|uniref:Uncharacterized protein n=1 Tax=Cymbomonas tetramitiformis TaxID=36881 RepID=A0AAE0EX67_9CHLO|nr:hypothetical protein CYMTET_46889 [Cymbomonas tetramitiformis]